jgi:hypothetical protein
MESCFHGEGMIMDNLALPDYHLSHRLLLEVNMFWDSLLMEMYWRGDGENMEIADQGQQMEM